MPAVLSSAARMPQRRCHWLPSPTAVPSCHAISRTEGARMLALLHRQLDTLRQAEEQTREAGAGAAAYLGSVGSMPFVPACCPAALPSQWLHACLRVLAHQVYHGDFPRLAHQPPSPFPHPHHLAGFGRVGGPVHAVWLLSSWFPRQRQSAQRQQRHRQRQLECSVRPASSCLPCSSCGRGGAGAAVPPSPAACRPPVCPGTRTGQQRGWGTTGGNAGRVGSSSAAKARHAI